MKKWFVFILLLFLLGFSPYHALLRADLRADDASYLSHAFSLGLDFNLQYRDMIADWQTQDGQVPAHPIGPGLLAAPFVALFSIIDRVTGDPVINDHRQYQYSWSLFGFIFASFFYFVSGIFLYAKGLKQLNVALPYWQLWLISVSFGILYYVLFRPIMGHSFEFFTLALCFYCSAQRVSTLSLLGIGLAVMLTLSIRPANINVVLLPLILFTFHTTITRQQWVSLLGVLLLSFLPLAWINYMLYGMAYPSAAAMYGAHLTPVPPLHSLSDVLSAIGVLITRLPYLLTISFSSEFGVAFSSAILFYGMLCLFYVLRRRFLPLCLTLIYAGLPVAIIVFWQSAGDAYAYRFLFCLFPLAILGYALVWQQKKRFAQYLQWGILASCLFGILGSTLFGLNEDLLYKQGSAKGYNIAVLRALPDPKIWLNCFATRTPGFYTVGLLERLAVDWNALPLPSALTLNVEKFKQSYHYPPARSYLQVLLLGAIFVGGSVLFCSRDKKR